MVLDLANSLANKRALICGASQGIGEATAQTLAKLGAEVILVARTQEKLEAVKSQLATKGGQKHQVLALDLSLTDSLNHALDSLLATGPISIVVNNAGGPKGGALLEATDEEFLQGFQAHILASSLIAKKVVPGMKEQRWGRFINIISTSVKAPIANLGVSNTIRGAMASWSKSLANELAPFGITVNNVLPGYTETPRLEALAQAAAQRQGKSVEEIKNLWKAATPAGRFAKPQEVAETIAFLASSSAGFITGINLPVDGGRTPCL
ncbi:MAG TPA: SDR family oxidoreductase [Pseudobdellovibrionaceae bacterium]